MKAKEIRDLSTEEIRIRIIDENEQLHKLRFQHAIADLQNPMVLRHKRRLIAQFETILQQRSKEKAVA